MLVKQKLLGALVGVFGLVGLAAPSSAETIQLVLHSSSPMAVGGNFEYVYDVILTGSSQVENGSLVTLYDVLGYVVGTADFDHNTDASLGLSASDFSLSEQLVGITPAGASYADNAALMNFTIEYEGDLFPDPAVNSPTLLGTFSLQSIYGDVANVYTTISKDLAADPDTGTTLSEQITRTDNVAGPVSQSNPAPAIPLPSAVWGGMGLIGVVIGMRVRKTRSM